ncbi:MAG TPA: hypothetical protein VGL69_06140 [Solirubrobacteraceae bacterium]
MSHPRFCIAAAALALAIGASGCATSSYDTAHQTAYERQHSILVGHEVADNNDDGTYVSAGPITYQLEISRVLNPWGAEDSQYFKGLPKGTSAFHIKPDQLWYGVFLWAKNQHHAAHWTSDKFEITDTLGRVYRPVRLNPNVNLLAWTSRKLVYGDTEPSQDSVASTFGSGGKIVLFKLNTSIYSNRPLTLWILSPAGKRIGEISLDL